MISAELSNQAARSDVGTKKMKKKVKVKKTAKGIPDTVEAEEITTGAVVEAAEKEVTFASLGVCEELCQACKLLKWTAPTRIQQESIPWALQGRDIIGLAETGSGKTGAFALPIIQRLLDTPQRFFAVALAPTRELCVQIGEQFEAIGSSIKLQTATIVGGLDMVTQAMALAKRPHVVVATPGRLVDHLENTKGFHLKTTKYLVMDEADRLLSMDFDEALDKILEVMPRDRNTFLFSATMTSKVSKLQRASLNRQVEEVEVEVDLDAGEQGFAEAPEEPEDEEVLALGAILVDEDERPWRKGKGEKGKGEPEKGKGEPEKGKGEPEKGKEALEEEQEKKDEKDERDWDEKAVEEESEKGKGEPEEAKGSPKPKRKGSPKKAVMKRLSFIGLKFMAPAVEDKLWIDSTEHEGSLVWMQWGKSHSDTPVQWWYADYDGVQKDGVHTMKWTHDIGSQLWKARDVKRNTIYDTSYKEPVENVTMEPEGKVTMEPEEEVTMPVKNKLTIRNRAVALATLNKQIAEIYIELNVPKSKWIPALTYTHFNATASTYPNLKHMKGAGEIWSEINFSRTRSFTGVYVGCPAPVCIVPLFCTFFVFEASLGMNACTLRGPREAAGWSLSFSSSDGKVQLRAEPGFNQPSLEQVGHIAGKSLSVPLDQAALGGIDVLHEAMRPLTEEEFELAAHAARASGPQEAPRREKPKALFVIAPSGGGKTTVLRTHAARFDMNPAEAVLIDSAVFRDFHAQYKAFVDNGLSNQGIWFRAWPAAKDVLVKAKKRILVAASEAKKDLLISDTGSDAQKLADAIVKLKESSWLDPANCRPLMCLFETLCDMSNGELATARELGEELAEETESHCFCRLSRKIGAARRLSSALLPSRLDGHPKALRLISRSALVVSTPGDYASELLAVPGLAATPSSRLPACLQWGPALVGVAETLLISEWFGCPSHCDCAPSAFALSFFVGWLTGVLLTLLVVNLSLRALGDLHISVTTSGTTESAASSSHGAEQASSFAEASSAPAAADVPPSPCSAAGSVPAPEPALDPWVSRFAAAVAAGEFAKQLLDGGRPNRWAKHPADLGGRRNTVHVVLQGWPGLGVEACYRATAEGLRLWTGQPCADGAVFHSFPSLREAQAYFEAAEVEAAAAAGVDQDAEAEDAASEQGEADEEEQYAGMQKAVTAAQSAEYDLFVGRLGGMDLLALVIMHREGGAMICIPALSNYEDLPDSAPRIPAEARGVRPTARATPTPSPFSCLLLDVDEEVFAAFSRVQDLAAIRRQLKPTAFRGVDSKFDGALLPFNGDLVRLADVWMSQNEDRWGSEFASANEGAAGLPVLQEDADQDLAWRMTMLPEPPVAVVAGRRYAADSINPHSPLAEQRWVEAQLAYLKAGAECSSPPSGKPAEFQYNSLINTMPGERRKVSGFIWMVCSRLPMDAAILPAKKVGSSVWLIPPPYDLRGKMPQMLGGRARERWKDKEAVGTHVNLPVAVWSLHALGRPAACPSSARLGRYLSDEQLLVVERFRNPMFEASRATAKLELQILESPVVLYSVSVASQKLELPILEAPVVLYSVSVASQKLERQILEAPVVLYSVSVAAQELKLQILESPVVLCSGSVASQKLELQILEAPVVLYSVAVASQKLSMRVKKYLKLDTSYSGRSRWLVIQILCIWALPACGLPALVLETNKMHYLGIPRGYYNCAQVIPMFFGLLLLIFKGVQEGFGADQTDGKPAPEAASSSALNAMLAKVYVAYTGGFVFFVLFLGFLEAVGVPDQAIGILFVTFILGMYAAIEIASRTSKSYDSYVADRNVPPIVNGRAAAAAWLSGASFVGMAVTLYALGYDGLAYSIGWTGGYVLVSIVIAPYFRRFGSFAVPGFIASRYQGTVQLFGGKVVELSGVSLFLATVVLLSWSFAYLSAQVYSAGFEVAVFSGLIRVLFCSLLGGMRAVTYTQVAQYVILIIAYTVPAICMPAAQDNGFNKNNPVEFLAYGGTLRAITLRKKEMVLLGLASKVTPYLKPKWRRVDFSALTFCLMVGTASLPHVLMRYFTAPSVCSARRSVTWSLGFILVLYMTAPAYATFAKLEVFTNVSMTPLNVLRKWIFTYGRIGLPTVCRKAMTSSSEAIAACAQASGGDYLLKFKDLKISTDAMVIATPEIAGLPYTIQGWFLGPADVLSMVAWASSLAASGKFPALCLGIWWRRTNAQGAIAGKICGWGLTLAYLLGTRYGGCALWGGISNVEAAVFGLPVGFAANINVSLLTPPPPDEVLAMVDSLRDFRVTGKDLTAEEREDIKEKEEALARTQVPQVSNTTKATAVATA
ncbi:unnamed protein product [Polarella glacialis]|uniref:Uncharacterized protein n=2 Tax=Polarella glacialis TaxID=89957 RepID=A0A813GQM6_POLGL|nr:unnamed protein product [Polarella glacialis]